MVGDIINQQSSKVRATQQVEMMPFYTAFIAVAVSLLWQPESDFSGLLTLSVIFQCSGYCLLRLHAFSTGSVQGISAKSLQLTAIAIACRLSSTTWLNGYVPSDPSGDYLYQSFDALSLVMVLWLLYGVRKARSGTHASEDDTLPVIPFAVGCFVLACLLHADLDGFRGRNNFLGHLFEDKRFSIFDTLWMCANFIEALSMRPQLWLSFRSSEKVPVVMHYFFAVMALSCILSGSWMYTALDEFTSKTWINKTIFNFSGYAVLAAHMVQWMFLAGFGYFSVKTFVAQDEPFGHIL